MTKTYNNKGVCSRSVTFDISEDGIVTNVSFLGGCNGNLKAISKLVDGLTVEQIEEISGVKFDEINIVGGGCQNDAGYGGLGGFLLLQQHIVCHNTLERHIDCLLDILSAGENACSVYGFSTHYP